MAYLTLHEQIARKCIHFNGIMEKECKAGINYDDVKVDKPFKFPCLKQGGECPCAKFLTDEEVEEKVKSIEEGGVKAMIAVAKIKDHYKNTKEPNGKIKCDCGGDLHYAVAQINGHVWAKCNSCKLSFNE
jgi:hypothetical protein